MSGVNDIIAFGFGAWSTVNKVPTMGFGVSAEVVLYVGSATSARTGIVGHASTQRTGIVGMGTALRTGIVGTAEIERQKS